MASSNAGTSLGSEYQVFLSFRGPDTRTGFTDILYQSLIDAGICVFRDDEELHVGERIDGSLQQAIDNSRIYIPIFSRTYASSQWCLRELTQIMANTTKPEGNKEILPIFYNVEPDDVKLKTPLYRDAILKLECEKKLTTELVDAWREALVKIDTIKGWEVKKYKGDSELVKLVVEEVVKKLKTKQRLVTENLVGIDDRVIAVSELLNVDSGGVRLIKIHGMGGIGKTTLAKVVFNRLSSHFGKFSCFLEDVRAKSSINNGLVELQKKLLSEISHPAVARRIDEIDDGMKRTGEALCNKKVFIVLDDVDSSKQVEQLLGKSTLYPGSRILITTRNIDVLRTYRSKYQILEYEMELMSFDYALQLFSKHAFDRDSPLDDYSDLSREVVSNTGRLPLALEVIGSSLYRKVQEQWKKALIELRKAPCEDVFRKLKISYDALSFEQQQIFLDIACFFIGEDKTNAFYMWEDCEFFPNTGVDVLINMSLVKITENNVFWMHNQVRDLGRNIVHRENPMNPGKRSRIWINKEVIDAIRTNELKENVQALDLDLFKFDNDTITSEEIGRFEHIRYLKLQGGTLVGNLANCLTKLTWLLWSHAPQMSKPTNMHLQNVVALQFASNNSIDDLKLHSFVKIAGKLRVLSLKKCESITRTPNFLGCPNLERLTFEECSNLSKIDSSIGKLKHLTHLKIDTCCSLEDLPREMGDLMNLKHFFLRCHEVKRLPYSIWKLKLFHEVHLLGHVNSANSWELPSAIGSLPFLRILDLSKIGVNVVPKSVNMLPCLQRLELRDCDEIQELPALPTSLTHLIVASKPLRVVPNLSNLTNLVELELNDWQGGRDKLCTGELWWIGRLSKITKLSFGLHNVPTPVELASLSLLNQLDLFGLDLQTNPQLPLSLQKLGLHYLNSIASLSLNLSNLSCLELSRSSMQEFQLDGLQFSNLKELHIKICVPLERLGLSNMRKLEDVQVRDCPKLVEIQFSGVFESLKALSIEKCKTLGRLVYVREAGHDSDESANELISCQGTLILLSGVFNKLQYLKLVCCPKILTIQVVGTSSISCEAFNVQGCTSLQSLHDLSNLRNLKNLHINDNNGLEVVEGLDELEFLINLEVHNCGLLERLIDVSSTKLADDCHMRISGCGKLLGVNKGFNGSFKAFKNYEEQKSDCKQEQESDLESNCEQKQEGDFEHKQESDFKLERERDFEHEFQEEQEGDFELEQERDSEHEFQEEQESDSGWSFEPEQEQESDSGWNFESEQEQETCSELEGEFQPNIWLSDLEDDYELEGEFQPNKGLSDSEDL